MSEKQHEREIYLKKIFCVEDDENIRELIEYTLSSSGFEVKGFACAADFFKAIQAENPSLILLDIMLPDIDGMDILASLRQSDKTKKIPVIMLTAKSSQLDKIKGLDSGADDYITKPFDILELIARINACLRRNHDDTSKANIYSYKELSIDTESHKVYADNTEIILTFKEFELLKILIINKGIVMTREKLMLKVWNTDFEGETRTVDVHIRSLRQKLGKYGEYIITVRNVGYKVG